MQSLHRLFYISRCKVDPCGPELRRILEVATSRNAALDVTGLLCCSGDHFAQLLEGQPGALEALMHSIRADARHCVLVEWPICATSAARWFPGWAMGYTFDTRLEDALGRLTAAPGDLPAIDSLAPELLGGFDLYRAAPISVV
ncbi:BLUF domain-containing protein [Eleftheria terrae]|uniref:BLUF domain-containing protein n=1 Tax=Eleftheria terrae TaxID=1597781 RepID=UPI00263AB4E6|nr:BLUF domain-containing protein [Eleftheria terrae]WKB56093.1 BLUF domain-containing protein [Eleftheria terrae]